MPLILGSFINKKPLGPEFMPPDSALQLDDSVLVPTACAICETLGQATELYPANFSAASLNPQVFSARRQPDRIHYRMVRCNGCGLIRSDPIANTVITNALYRRSSFDYGEETCNLKRSYGRYLALMRRLASCNSLLEIGCGNGFFLDEALNQGVPDVIGVEPSEGAIAAAPKRLQQRIVCDILRPDLFPPAQFDMICMFQVLDHIAAPRQFLESCFRILRPGGLVLALNHNADSHSARLLQERSPIVDIEHTYLYTPRTMAKLFMRGGFEILKAGPVWNQYSIKYLTFLFPFPSVVKKAILALYKIVPLGNIPLLVPLGNLYQIARKPL